MPHTLVREDGEPAATNELEIAEWGCHDRHVGLQVWPPEERSRLEREFGPHPVFGMAAPAARSFAPDDYIHRAGARRRPEEDRRLTEGLLSGIALKERLSRKYLAARDWDLFLTVFGEAHAVGHQQWHLHDTAHPDFDAAAQQAIGGDPVARVYAGLDAALGRLLAAVDERTTVLVMLSHGMGPHHDGTHLLDEVLRRIDRADRASEGESWREAGWRRLGDLQGLLGKTVRRLRGGPPREFVSAGERARQRFFLAPNNYVYGGIRLNMCGREPRGRVAPEDIGRVIAGLERDLKALVNLATGAPVIRGIERAGRWYRRSNDDTMPDLFIDWERSAPIETVWSQKTGRVHAPYVNWRTGDHRPRGLLLAVGPGIEAGSALPEMAIEDLPASLAVRFGVAHDDMDGRPADWLRG